MKRLILVFSCLFCFLPDLKAQTYHDYAGEMFLYSQPNARAEAMGRGSAALTGSPFMSFYNPAAASFSGSVTMEFSRLDFLPSFRQSGDQEIYDTYGIGVNFGGFGAFSMNYLHFSGSGWFVNINPIDVGDFALLPSYTDIYMLNYSFPVLKSMSVGINANYFRQNYSRNYLENPEKWYFDLGLLKEFTVGSGPAEQDLYLGLSFMNLSNQKFPLIFKRQNFTINYRIPSVMRLASAYKIQLPGKMSDFRLLKGLFTAEYFDLLNSKYHSKFGIGAELTFLEMLNLRAGWFTEELYNYGLNSIKSGINEFTYGFGIEAPLRKIPGIRVPLNIKFDYTSLPFPEYFNNDVRDEYNSPIYSFNISYGI